MAHQDSHDMWDVMPSLKVKKVKEKVPKKERDCACGRKAKQGCCNKCRHAMENQLTVAALVEVFHRDYDVYSRKHGSLLPEKFLELREVRRVYGKIKPPEKNLFGVLAKELMDVAVLKHQEQPVSVDVACEYHRSNPTGRPIESSFRTFRESTAALPTDFFPQLLSGDTSLQKPMSTIGKILFKCRDAILQAPKASNAKNLDAVRSRCTLFPWSKTEIKEAVAKARQTSTNRKVLLHDMSVGVSLLLFGHNLFETYMEKMSPTNVQWGIDPHHHQQQQQQQQHHHHQQQQQQQQQQHQQQQPRDEWLNRYFGEVVKDCRDTLLTWEDLDIHLQPNQMHQQQQANEYCVKINRHPDGTPVGNPVFVQSELNALSEDIVTYFGCVEISLARVAEAQLPAVQTYMTAWLAHDLTALGYDVSAPSGIQAQFLLHLLETDKKSIQAFEASFREYVASSCGVVDLSDCLVVEHRRYPGVTNIAAWVDTKDASSQAFSDESVRCTVEDFLSGLRTDPAQQLKCQQELRHHNMRFSTRPTTVKGNKTIQVKSILERHALLEVQQLSEGVIKSGRASTLLKKMYKEIGSIISQNTDATVTTDHLRFELHGHDNAVYMLMDCSPASPENIRKAVASWKKSWRTDSSQRAQSLRALRMKGYHVKEVCPQAPLAEEMNVFRRVLNPTGGEQQQRGDEKDTTVDASEIRPADMHDANDTTSKPKRKPLWRRARKSVGARLPSVLKTRFGTHRRSGYAEISSSADPHPDDTERSDAGAQLLAEPPVQKKRELPK